MILIIGGAYNGKLDFVKETFNVEDKDIFFCNEGNIDFSKNVICGLHKFIYYNRESAFNIINENLEALKDKIIICDEISSGIVPLKKEERQWRELTGKVLQLLSKNSNSVYRIFCGLPMVIKDE